MHVRTPVGTRVEVGAGQFAESRKQSAKSFRRNELATIVDNIGVPVSGINMTYNNTGTIGSQDGDIQIKLTEEHKPTATYVRLLREELPARFPGTTFSFLPPDIISQILNFGAPAPIDLQIRGPRLDADYAYADELLRRLRHVPGLVDVRIQQSDRGPSFNVDVDRTRAGYVGVTERDVTNSMVVNLAGSSQVAPTFWLNPENGVQYSDRHADAAISNGFAERAQEPADDGGRAQRRKRSVPSPTSSASARPPWYRNTTFRIWCRSTARPRAAISARLRPTSRRSWMRRPAFARRACRSRCSGRSTP